MPQIEKQENVGPTCGCWYTWEDGRECVHEKQLRIAEAVKTASPNSSEALEVLAFIAAGYISGRLSFESLGNNRIKVYEKFYDLIISWEGSPASWVEAISKTFEAM